MESFCLFKHKASFLICKIGLKIVQSILSCSWDVVLAACNNLLIFYQVFELQTLKDFSYLYHRQVCLFKPPSEGL